MLNKNQAKELMNKMGNRPFLFLLDFDGVNNIVLPMDEVNSDEMKYFFQDNYTSFRNHLPVDINKKLDFAIQPISFEKYSKAFEIVVQNLHLGNSFLTNLTAETKITSNYSLEDFFYAANAKYKLLLKDKFVCFSPETFVSVDKDGIISSFPMKGTIDAELADAEKIILENPKEKFEHTTIVDLIRNDLSKICQSVWVKKFRYIDTITRHDNTKILQVSSEICGQLPVDWQRNIGTWLFELLPAGSITGAPKAKTVEIIKNAEKLTYKNGERGFYTGVFGIFDGEILTSAVMIRYIEQQKSGLVFKSGGGITSRSEVESEYYELIQKIYVPIF